MKHLGILLAIIVFVIQASLVSGTGMTWDEPSSFFFGRANLKYWTTGNRAYLTDYRNPALFKDSPFWYVWGEHIYPPFPFLVSSVTSLVFAEKLHLMSFVDAHHVGEVVLGSLSVWAMYGLATAAGLSVPVAAGTALIYALYPTIFGQMRSDAKDVPLMSILVVSVYFFVTAIQAFQSNRKNKAWIWRGIGAAVFLGLAEASKPTAVIIVPILLVWLLVSLLTQPQFRKKFKPMGPLLGMLPVFGVIALMIFFLGWPWLLDNPYARLLEAWEFFKNVGKFMPVPYVRTMYQAGANVPKMYPFGILVFQTPLEVTLLSLVGMGAAIWAFVKKKHVYPLLFLIWFILGIGRFILPNFIIYAKVRHFIDAMPAFFILVGLGIEAVALGVKELFTDAHKRMAFLKQSLTWTVVIALFVIFHEAAIDREFYPYEPTYFNSLIGGTKTVADQGLFDVEYWASGVKETVEFINKTAPPTATIYACQMKHLAIYYKRPGIGVTDDPARADYAIVPNSPSWFSGPLGFYKANHELVYTVKRGGGDLFYVFKYKSPNGWNCGGETETTYQE